MIGIVVGTLLLSLLFVGWAIGGDLMRFFSGELSRTIRERLDAVDTLYVNFESGLYDNGSALMRSRDLGVLGATPEYNNAVRNVYSLFASDALSKMIQEQELQDVVASVVVYPEVSDYYIVAQGISPKTGNVKLPENMEEIFSALEEKKQTDIPLQRLYLFLGSYQDQDALVYVYPISKYYFYGTGYVIITVWEDAVCEMLNGIGYNTEGTSILMIGDDGRVLSAKDKTLLGMSYEDALERLGQQKQENAFLGLNDPEQLTVTFTGAQRFVADYHTSELSDSILLFLRNSVTVFAVSTIVAVIFASLLLRKTYRPLQQLIRSVRQRTDFNGADTELLSNVFQSLIRNESDLRNRLQSNALTQKEHDVLCLLNHRGQYSGNADVIPQKRYYFALTVWIDQYSQYLEQFNNEERFYNKSFVTQLFEQYPDEDLHFTAVILFSGSIGVIGCTDLGDVQKLHAALTQISDQVQKSISYSISIGCGMLVTQVEEIWKSFQQSREAVSHRYFLGRDCISFFDGELKNAGLYRYPVREEKRLINQLLSGNAQEIQHSVADFFTAISGTEQAVVDNTLHCLNSLVINLWSVVVENPSFNCQDIHVFVFLENLLGQETLEDARQVLTTFLMQLLERRQSGEKTTQSGDIISYINENYMQDLDISAVASRFGLSYSYVRKLFKEKTGKTILDYLNGLRVVRVKELLTQTDDTIGEIAAQAGFYNEQALFRTFKKYEGITPGDYRKTAAAKVVAYHQQQQKSPAETENDESASSAG